MSLELDARQRAMLQEMGVTVSAAPPARPAPEPAPAQPAAVRAEAAAPPPMPAAAPAHARPAYHPLWRGRRP